MTEPTPIEVAEVIGVQYNGSYPGNEDAEHCSYTLGEDGCATDINGPEGIPDGVIDDLDLTCEPMLSWLHTNDPLIDFTGAIVNNDEHYIMSTGCMVQELNHNKLELTGIVGDSTYIDVEVVRPSGKKIK